jgi:hypothetical protein
MREKVRLKESVVSRSSISREKNIDKNYNVGKGRM